ncbi:uncharacterized protein LOC143853993 isoform X2 [Tasmannia lanceolata]|uniref:uncharacterized protein LOC143853993 isoform X2 n=1 Tax=Tasmannia lanceolata TaxID=3420 RepID=UPI004064AA43
MEYNNLNKSYLHLPSCMSNLSKLEILILRGHFGISTGLCKLNNLKELYLAENNLNDDHLPSCLWNLSKLETLFLSSNKLGGHFGISTRLCKLNNLKEFYLAENNLNDDHLPSCLRNLSKLETLFLSSNKLGGHFGISTASSEASGLPQFLMGETMGGAVALKAHLKKPHEWHGVILVAPTHVQR